MAGIKAGDIIRGQDLDGQDWTVADLPGVTLESCTLTDAVLSNVVLEEASFRRCRFVRCRFSHTDLRETVFEDCQFNDPDGQKGAIFSFCRMEQTKMIRCDLRRARFEGTELYAAAIEDCNLMGVRFHRTGFAKSFGRNIVRTNGSFAGSNLELAEMAGMRLPGIDLRRCRLRETDLTGADLEGADLTGADLFQAILTDARLAKADLRDAELSGLDPRILATSEDLKITAAHGPGRRAPWRCRRRGRGHPAGNGRRHRLLARGRPRVALGADRDPRLQRRHSAGGRGLEVRQRRVVTAARERGHVARAVVGVAVEARLLHRLPHILLHRLDSPDRHVGIDATDHLSNRRDQARSLESPGSSVFGGGFGVGRVCKAAGRAGRIVLSSTPSAWMMIPLRFSVSCPGSR